MVKTQGCNRSQLSVTRLHARTLHVLPCFAVMFIFVVNLLVLACQVVSEATTPGSRSQFIPHAGLSWTLV